jgi:hypothetical protein
MDLVGREREAEDLVSLLAAHAVVAVWGPPGIGKSALVRAVAARFPETLIFDGVPLPEDLPQGSRAIVISRERPAQLPGLELGPLPREAQLELVARLERERGRTLSEELAARSEGNPQALRTLMGLVESDELLRLAREQLRWGEFDAARATCESALSTDLSKEAQRRARLLLAEALVRAGDPQAAAQELAQAGPDMAVDLALAELAVLRGELVSARRALLLLRPTHPALQGRRAVALALSYLFEDRHRLALAWARRAKRAYARRERGAADPLAPIVEVAALLNLDRIDAAMQAASREERATKSLGGGPVVLFQAGVLFRRGQLADALEVAEPAYRALDRKADRIFRAIVGHYSCRVAIALGKLELAEEFLRGTLGIAESPGLGALRPLCELDFALLCEARGRRDEARERARRAVEALPRSPIARAEAWALGALAEKPRAAEASAAAFIALRSAERALEEGDLRASSEEATLAASWYERAGAGYELSRARLCLAEAAARQGGDFGPALESSPYPPVRVAALLIRAAVCDRDGRLDDARAALKSTLHESELRGASLLRACARFGVGDLPAPAAVDPFAARVKRLGLDRPADLLAESADRRWLLAAHDPLPRKFDLLVRLDRGGVAGAGGDEPLPPQQLLLLEALVRAGPHGASVEELYQKAWRAKSFHPLRHRNTVYVALARLRDSLRDILEGDTLVEIEGGRYRVAQGLHPVVVCRAPSAARAKGNSRSDAARRQTK